MYSLIFVCFEWPLVQPLLRFLGVIVAVVFDHRVICTYDCLGWANVIDSLVHSYYIPIRNWANRVIWSQLL